MKYRVTVVTPTLVGDGTKLSPIDYMVWRDQVNVLDQTRIFRLLSKGPRLEEYLTQLRRATKRTQVQTGYTLRLEHCTQYYSFSRHKRFAISKSKRKI